MPKGLRCQMPLPRYTRVHGYAVLSSQERQRSTNGASVEERPQESGFSPLEPDVRALSLCLAAAVAHARPALVRKIDPSKIYPSSAVAPATVIAVGRG